MISGCKITFCCNFLVFLLRVNKFFFFIRKYSVLSVCRKEIVNSRFSTVRVKRVKGNYCVHAHRVKHVNPPSFPCATLVQDLGEALELGKLVYGHVLY